MYVIDYNFLQFYESREFKMSYLTVTSTRFMMVAVSLVRLTSHRNW